MRRQAKLLQRNEFGGLLDATFDVVLRFQPARLRSNQAEYDRLPFRHEAQRLKATGAIGVEFHEISMHVDRVEQDFRYRLVAA